MSPFLEQIEQQLHTAIENDNLESLREILNDEYPADIANALERLQVEDRLEAFRLLQPEIAAEVLNELGVDSTRELIQLMSPEEVGDLLDEMPMDDAVEILTEDIPEFQEIYLAEMDPEDAAEVQRLLSYPPDSAGLLMTEKYVSVSINDDLTAAEAIEHVRQVDEEVETVSDLYILDDEKHLMGVVSLRQVVTAQPENYIRDIMETDLVTVPPEMDQEQAARLISRYNFFAIPVVDKNQRMLGIITVDDAMDVLTEENTEDILRFGGVDQGSDQPYFTIPLFKVLRSRFGWLLLLMVADTLTGTVMRMFDAQLAALVSLSFYIPLLIGTGGNTGAQTVSTIIRGLAIQDIRFRDIFRVLRREFLGGLLLGLALSLVAGTRSYLWDGNLELALVVGISIIIICTWANVMGSVIPLIAHKVGIDPAVVSAPMISTLVDATGLFLYLSIASAILNLP